MSRLRLLQYLLAVLGAGILLVLFALNWPDPVGPEMPAVIATEQVGQHATLRTIEDNTIRYTELAYRWNGDRYTVRFAPRLRPALDWIRRHTRPDATIAAWWIHGHSIRGYSRRPVTVTAPTFWAWDNVIGGGNQTRWDAARRGEFADQRTFRDHARSLTTDNMSYAHTILGQHNVSYLLLTKTDLRHYTEMAQVADHDAENVSTLHVRHCRTAGTDCRIRNRGGQPILTYPIDTHRSITVPVRSTDTGYRLDGAPRFVAGNRSLIIPFHCTSDGTKRIAVSETELRGCVRFHPDHGHTRLVYVPGPALDSLLVRLYLLGGAPGFDKRYDDSHAQVWEVGSE